MSLVSKLVMLLSTPFPLLYPRRFAVGLVCHSRLDLATPFPTAPSRPCNRFYRALPVSPHRQRARFSVRAAEEFHTGSADGVDYEQLPRTWNGSPEWSRFVEHITAGAHGSKRTFLSAAAVSDRDGDDDSFIASCDLPEDFRRAAEACLAFARERPVLLKLLSKKNVKALVDNGSPFLFYNGINSSRRMAHYLSNEGINLSEAEAAQTVDLMRYLLSYFYSQLVSSKVGSFSATKLVETSVNALLTDMVNTSSLVRQPPVSMSSFSSDISSSLSQNIEMRIGDWICPKCSYLNFARNMKCLKCDEGRPKKQLTGGEWECPQCDFYNYGRNMVCLRCDCKRPASASDKATLGYAREPSFEQIHVQDSASTSGMTWPLLDKDKKAERWFPKVAEPNSSTVLSSVITDESSSDIVSQKGPTGLANTVKHSSLSAEGSANTSNKGLDPSITRSLEKILGQSPRTSGSVSSSEQKQSASVPFVPLPPDMFKNHQNSSVQEKYLENRVSSSKGDVQNVPAERFQGYSGSVPHYESSHNFNADKEMFNSPKDTTQHNDKNQTTSEFSDDFPEIMPMRKGENRFVVSRKKDRSLTSPQYKRRLAMEQAGGSNFVPFVPFPPGYFARKDNQGGDGVLTNSQSLSSVPGKSDVGEATDSNGVAKSDANQSTKNWNSESFGRNPTLNSQMSPSAGGFNSSPLNDGALKKNEMRTADFSQVRSSPAYATNSNTLQSNDTHRTNIPRRVDIRSSESTNREPTSSLNGYQEKRSTEFLGNKQTNDTHNPENFNSYWNKNEQSSDNGYSSWNRSSYRNTDEKAKIQSGNSSGWGSAGKSLEGSAVPEEPDPLDMSEEAKAQRWFRRVAQITDISELSKIPDEDFPEIMPMRKGVNRFVVSKRKTPLERRLTSPQYRRNLPIVSSDPEKDSNKKF